jgi:hypothetical protein
MVNGMIRKQLMLKDLLILTIPTMVKVEKIIEKPNMITGIVIVMTAVLIRRRTLRRTLQKCIKLFKRIPM